MNIQESNKLIADFEGYEIYEMNGYIQIHYSDDNIRTIADTHYHSSWDWLMPVLDKIKDICFSDEWGETYDSEYFYDIRDCIPDINHTYKAVVQFIELYNKTNS